ncbi:MAG TPA: L,D-transpeptidase family protein [Solirubrobacteraceae bacterium]|nr:L,D-transpeptidase family protein [Solirubrobacteraceae bacterium]
MRRPALLFVLLVPLLALAVGAVLFATGPLAPGVTLTGERGVAADAPLRFATTGVVSALSVEIDGAPVPVREVEGKWETSGTPLAHGQRTISVRAAGPGGLFSAQERWTVSVDGMPPELEVDAGRYTDGASVRLRGSSEAGAALRVEGGERPASTSAGRDGDFALEVPLRGGANRLEIVAADAAGNQTDEALRVVRDSAAPELVLDTSDSVDSSTPTVAVTAEDTTRVTVHAELDGKRVGEKRQAGDGAVELSFGWLPDGAHAVTVVARDRAGNEERAEETLVVDTSETFGVATLAEGARGDDVRTFLRLLREHGGYDGPVAGTLGAQAMRALRDFQRRRDLAVDGLAGPQLRASLLRKLDAGVVIDRSARTLTFTRGGYRVRRFPVAVGMSQYPTPLGARSVVDKQVDPAWTPPDSPWAAELDTIPSGPGNPLGTRWIGLGDAIGIHGTYATGTVGTAASHGCIRMLIPDVEWLYGQLPMGSRVRITA